MLRLWLFKNFNVKVFTSVVQRILSLLTYYNWSGMSPKLMFSLLGVFLLTGLVTSDVSIE